MINIVLIEPEIPQNTGNIARTCAVTGASLHLIEPLGFKIDNAKLKRAGLDYWHNLNITYYKNIDEFFSINRINKHTDFDNINSSFHFFTTKAEKIYSDAVYEDNCFLIFGKETAGIKEDLLIKNLNRCVRIPMMGELRSLNLSNAVAVATYEVLRQKGFENLNTKGKFQNL